MSASRFRTLLGRALRLRCPLCGKGPLFAGAFRMHHQCAHCQVPFEREQGFFLGAIYISYGITAIISMAMYFIIWGNNWWGEQQTMSLVSPGKLIPAIFSVLSVLCLFRHSRALWLAFDQYHDPRPGELSNGPPQAQ